MTIVNPLGKPIKKYVDAQVSAEESARKTADANLQSNIETINEELDSKVPTSRTVNGHALTADVTVTKADVGLGDTDNGAKAPSTDATLASTTNPPTAKVVKDYVDGKFAGDLGTAAYKDVGTAAGNVPVLGSDGKLAASTIPELAISRYLGAVETVAELTTLTSNAQIGDWATVTKDTEESKNGAYMLTATTGLEGTWTQISGPTSLVWGKIGGTLSEQSDLQTALDEKQNQIVAGTGITLGTDKKTLSISSTVTAGSIGSATVIPKLTYNAQGQITKAESVTVYPPTTAGTSGQLWQSDGSEAGAWVTPASSSTVTAGADSVIMTKGATSKLVSDAVASAGHHKIMIVKGSAEFNASQVTVTFKQPGVAKGTTDKATAVGDAFDGFLTEAKADSCIITCTPSAGFEDNWVALGISMSDLSYADGTYTATFSVIKTSAGVGTMDFSIMCVGYN